MKTLLIVVCVVVANVQAIEVVQQLLSSALTDCKEKVQATQEDIMEILKHKALTTTASKCLITCLNKKFKIQTATGEIDAKAAKEALKLVKFLGEDVYQQLIGIADVCLAQVHTGDNECDIGASFFTCSVNGITAANLPHTLADLII